MYDYMNTTLREKLAVVLPRNRNTSTEREQETTSPSRFSFNVSNNQLLKIFSFSHILGRQPEAAVEETSSSTATTTSNQEILEAEILEMQQAPQELKDQLSVHGFQVCKFLGSGAFSEVWLADWKKTETSEDHPSEVAAKVFTGKFTSLSREQLLDVAKTEAGIASKFKHENVVRTFGLTTDAHVICLAVEYCSRGDLLDNVTPNIGLPAEDGRAILTGICAGLSYMHNEYSLAHLDIKAENVMIAPGPVAKLADFDATMPFGARMRQVRGTRDIHPPEYLKPLSTSQGGLPQAYVIDGSADVWAVGLLLHVSIFGRYAWDVADMSDARYARFRRKGQSSFPVNTPVSLVNAFADALAEDVASRSTMTALQDTIDSEWDIWVETLRAPPPAKVKTGSGFGRIGRYLLGSKGKGSTRH
jgi:serine/threonine protein kinase